MRSARGGAAIEFVREPITKSVPIDGKRAIGPPAAPRDTVRRAGRTWLRRGRLALVFELRGAQFERKRCAQWAKIGTDVGAVVPELEATLSAISALRRRNVSHSGISLDASRRESPRLSDDSPRLDRLRLISPTQISPNGAGTLSLELTQM